MDLRVTRPHRNGVYEAPQLPSGASSVPGARRGGPTVFPPDVPLRGAHALGYGLQRFQIGSIPLSRLLAALPLLMAAVWATGLVPGRWWGSAAWLLAWAAYLVWVQRQQATGFVRFVPGPAPSLTGAPFDPSEKTPIYATGLLTVEGKYRHFTWLPGFYRTFATGEHAVLCQVRLRRWALVAEWPAEESGMWYAFIDPAAITALHWGELRFGENRSPAIGVDYKLTIPPDARHKRPRVRGERIYLCCAEPTDTGRLYADLQQGLVPGRAEPKRP